MSQCIFCKIIAGEIPAVNQMHSQFSGASSGHGVTLTGE